MIFCDGHAKERDRDDQGREEGRGREQGGGGDGRKDGKKLEIGERGLERKKGRWKGWKEEIRGMRGGRK